VLTEAVEVEIAARAPRAEPTKGTVRRGQAEAEKALETAYATWRGNNKGPDHTGAWILPNQQAEVTAKGDGWRIRWSRAAPAGFGFSSRLM
jgi:hypothetical protein